jgi:hypothetical protein
MSCQRLVKMLSSTMHVDGSGLKASCFGPSPSAALKDCWTRWRVLYQTTAISCTSWLLTSICQDDRLDYQACVSGLLKCCVFGACQLLDSSACSL